MLAIGPNPCRDTSVCVWMLLSLAFRCVTHQNQPMFPSPIFEQSGATCTSECTCTVLGGDFVMTWYFDSEFLTHARATLAQRFQESTSWIEDELFDWSWHGWPECKFIYAAKHQLGAPERQSSALSWCGLLFALVIPATWKPCLSCWEFIAFSKTFHFDDWIITNLRETKLPTLARLSELWLFFPISKLTLMRFWIHRRNMFVTHTK